MKAKELIGKEVLDSEARRVGKVVDLDLDMAEARLKNIEVKAGLMKGFIIGLDKINLVGDKIILNVKGNEL